ncbi:BTB/POZ domain-containing protein 3-like [Nilaparvata lugens]|uniref:BTB/POZ domain-containing protein 3-like n=1 Tax=Nilaparvata lugens TaxID=108931 RepID=UPI00193D1268|nr:BTB/POZ domain-containing protein 3-like [Nilaparvata lugens]
MSRSYGKFKNRFLQASNNGIGYDCKFIVGPDNTAIQGHKFLFSVASEVFQAMFYGDLKEENAVKIDDLDFEGFESMKHFIYTGEVRFTSAIHALSTYIAARKYIIPELNKGCMNYIKKQLNPSEVLEFYEHCETCNAPEFEELCLKIMEEKTDQIVDSDYFPTAKAETIKLILKSRSLSLKSEIEVFNLFEKWALAEAARRQIGDSELASSFNHLKKYVRFLTISRGEFTKLIEKSLLLTPTEKRAIESNLLQSYSKPMPVDLSVVQMQRSFLPKSVTSETFQYSHTFVISLKSACASCKTTKTWIKFCDLTLIISPEHGDRNIFFYVRPSRYSCGLNRISMNYRIETKVSVLATNEIDDLIFRDRSKFFVNSNLSNDQQDKVTVAEIPIHLITNKYISRGTHDHVKVQIQFNIE